MLDRLMQNHHRFKLTGESMRKNATAKPKVGKLPEVSHSA
jgi:DNA replication protein DnaC